MIERMCEITSALDDGNSVLMTEKPLRADYYGVVDTGKKS